MKQHKKQNNWLLLLLGVYSIIGSIAVAFINKNSITLLTVISGCFFVFGLLAVILAPVRGLINHSKDS